MPRPAAIPQKVLIYATSSRGLLVFDEPDFPAVPTQVPGGTVDPGENIFDAANLEFHEETGMLGCTGLQLLGTTDHHFMRDGVSYTLCRNYFYLILAGEQPESWHHYEMAPHGGGAPILFRFFWLDVSQARSRLGLGMEEYLDRIPL